MHSIWSVDDLGIRGSIIADPVCRMTYRIRCADSFCCRIRSTEIPHVFKIRKAKPSVAVELAWKRDPAPPVFGALPGTGVVVKALMDQSQTAKVPAWTEKRPRWVLRWLPGGHEPLHPGAGPGT
jgi:hypothetical protein